MPEPGTLQSYLASAFPVASKAYDPPTSHVAEGAVTASGQRGTHLSLVLGALERVPGACAPELAAEIREFDVYEVRRRLSDAETMGLAYKQGARRHGKRQHSRWWLADRQERLPL